jgi:hypothetical protein
MFVERASNNYAFHPDEIAFVTERGAGVAHESTLQLTKNNKFN